VLTGGKVNLKNTLEFPIYWMKFAILKKWLEWGIKRKNLSFSRSGGEKSAVYLVFLALSA